MATPVLNLEKGKTLFREGDVATSLFILKKGQLRLYKDKGDGIVDIAILRAGEVLGEMSYFDSDSTRRNCSANAMTDLEYNEISFTNFSKVIDNLNPWFKTIITTLVERLNKSNARIKSLEAVSAIDYSDNGNSLTSLKIIDFSKVISTLYLCFKAHGKAVGDKHALSKKVLNMYAREVYNISEAKLEQIITGFTDLKILNVVSEADDELILTDQLSELKSILVSFNAERHLTEDKKIKVSKKCFFFLEKIWQKAKGQSNPQGIVYIEISSILASLKENQVSIDDLSDARELGFVQSVLVDSNTYSLPVNIEMLQKYISFLKVKNYFYK